MVVRFRNVEGSNGRKVVDVAGMLEGGRSADGALTKTGDRAAVERVFGRTGGSSKGRAMTVLRVKDRSA